MEEIILKNLEIITNRITKTAIKCNRNPNEIRLLLATKTVPANRIRIALKNGHMLIGENKVQEIKAKYTDLMDIPHGHHFIGHLQTNKIKDILKYPISCIQSLDRMDLALKLNERLLNENKTMDVLIQVNTSGEVSKFGIHPDETILFIKEVAQLPTLRIKGLMTIGLFSAETEKVRPCFRLLKKIQEEVRALELPDVEMKELSMGMSGDLETAIEEGATIVRVGTAIFGQRIYPDSYYWNELK